MRFLPHTEDEIAQMLAAIGVESIDALLEHVPERLRQSAGINLPPGAGEQAVAAEIEALARRNAAGNFVSFLGGGYYRHYIPAAVRAVASRAEFATAYTPYQPEASQGTLQAIFEFQTLITQLTGLEVANASMYDGASAAAEAVMMARRLRPDRRIVALSRALWPDYRATIATYLSALDQIEIIELPCAGNGRVDLAELQRLADPNLLCAVLGYPNAFGIVEPLAQAAKSVHDAGALAIAVTAESLSLALLKPPGALGVDIAVGEGQSFGLPLQYGGPGFGYLAARLAYLRQIPGRLVGQSIDRNGRRAFSLTLATREQHIRRQRATSNICTNHSLCALTATVYLSLMGQKGLRRLAEHNVELAHLAADRIAQAGGKLFFPAPFFNEFVVRVRDARQLLRTAEQRGLLAGIAMEPHYPELPDSLLVSVTEMNTMNDIDSLSAVVAEGM